jgi:catechol 2,3-dioxygenase-like lactoylglutathione lyase family enzyme
VKVIRIVRDHRINFMKAPNLLENAPLIMLSRRIIDLRRTKQTIAALHRWPILGNELTCVVYKAGKTLLAFRTADDNLSAVPSISENGKSSLLIHNAASSIVIAVPAIRKVINTLAKCECITADCTESLSSDGCTFSYVDDYGNATSFKQYHDGVHTGTDESGSDRLVRRASINNGPLPHRLVAVHLLVSDLQRSVQFYHHVLGLELIKLTANSAVLNVSTLTLTLTVEPVCGLVAALDRSQRLSGDRLTFAVADIQRTIQTLIARGITPSASIGESLIGRRVLISDPDGRLLTLWERREHIQNSEYYRLGRQLVVHSARMTAQLGVS